MRRNPLKCFEYVLDSRKFIIGLLTFFLINGITAAQGNKHIAPYEPIFQDLRFLQSQGLLLKVNLSALPVSEKDVLDAISSDMKTGKIDSVDLISREIVTRIIFDLADDPERFSDNQSPLKTTVDKTFSRIKGMVSGSKEKRGRERILLGVNSEDWLSFENGKSKVSPQIRTRARWQTGPLMIFNSMTVDPKAPENPHYIGKEWRGLAGYTEEAYMTYRSSRNSIGLDFGRFYLTWGPGETGKLHFSSVARPMDMLRIRIGRGLFRFSGFTARLDMLNDNNRYLSAHRLDIRPVPGLIIGINESILYGGRDQNFELAYLNPFIFYHAVQMNGPGMLGNTIGSVDVSWFTSLRVHLYASLMIDDIQLDKKEQGDLEPNEIGFLFGIEKGNPFGSTGSRLGFEYTAVTNRTYKTPNEYERFIHRGFPLGYYLGDDFDHSCLWIDKYFSARWRLNLAAYLIRKGEGDLYAPWDEPWKEFTVKEGYSEPFPTGVVERHLGIRGEVRFMPDYKKQFFLKIETEDISNFNHEKGKRKTDYEIGLGLWLDIYKKWDI